MTDNVFRCQKKTKEDCRAWSTRGQQGRHKWFVSFFGEPGNPVSFLEGIKAKVSPNTTVTFHRGCELYDQSFQGIDYAVQIARDTRNEGNTNAQGRAATFAGDKNVTQTPSSRSDIGLPGAKLELIQAIKKAGIPVVVTLVNHIPSN